MQREGKYPLPAGASKTILGVEFAGVVSKAGEGIEKFKEGDEVFGLAYGVCCLPLHLHHFHQSDEETWDMGRMKLIKIGSIRRIYMLS